MVRCPYCGEAMPPEAYIGHVSRHGEEASWERLSPERLMSGQKIRPLSELRRSVYASDLKRILSSDEKELIGKFLEERARYWEDCAKYEPAIAVRRENIVHFSTRISELAGLADALGLDQVYNRIGIIAQIVANLRLV